MPKRAVIIGNGVLDAESEVLSLLQKADYIVCADGGAAHLLGTAIKPDVIVGDMDSITSETLDVFKDVEIVKDLSDDRTDMAKGIELLLSRGYPDITMLGATGGRPDQSLANISLLRRFDERAILRILNDRAETTYIAEETTFESFIGRKISLIVLEGISTITTEGLRWNLRDSSHGFDAFGISNEVISSPVTIKTSGGVYLFKLNELSDGTPTDPVF